MELKKKVVSGVFWTVGEKAGSLFVSTCVSIVLLTLLDPAVFGFVAMLTVFSAIGNSIADSGFSQALIVQKSKVDQTDYSSVFWLNTAIAVILYVILVSLSGAISRFYDVPLLKELAPWVFAIIPLGALGLVQNTVLTKEMDFKSLSKINFTTSLVSELTALGMALAGFGIWALIARLLVLHSVRIAMLWGISKWRPGMEFSMPAVKGLFGLGSRLFATGMITQLFNHFSMLLIGRFYDATRLGLYERSLKLKDSVLLAVSVSVQNVTFPAFSSIRDDNEKLRFSSRKVISVLSFVLFPAMLGLISVADEGFMIVGREKWLPAAPYFKILALSALCIPMSNISLNLLKAKGRGNTILNIELVKKAFGIAVIVYAATVSVYAVAWAYLAWVVFEMVLNQYFAKRLTGYRTVEQLRDTMPYLVNSLIMYLFILLAGHFAAGLSVYLILPIKILTGIGIYLLVSWLRRPEAWNEALAIRRELISKRK